MKLSEKKIRVAVYARVSTEHEAQILALGNQIEYYDNLFVLHPDWVLINRYIDEGITGTQAKKRPQFMQMIHDAEQGEFDLIITREVSRFARNTVDTLNYTRRLKKNDVEVYFIEDNIRTMDSDGELRLTLMATLAQDESRKTSIRVRVGQKVSRDNGVIYGNGNILGYDRVDDKYIINEEQAETVRLIFDLYTSGMGLRTIQFELEKMDKKTSTGNKIWHAATISRILKNSTYCGEMQYNKSYVDDYLEQNRKTNYGELAQVTKEDTHPAIVSKEQWQLANAIIGSKSSKKDKTSKKGVKPSLDIWSNKLRCKCGGSFNRQKWHVTKDGSKQYGYQCYKQIQTGTIRTRLKKGLSTDGICDATFIAGWKLDLMACELFKLIWLDKDKILDMAYRAIEKHISDNNHDDEAQKAKKFQKDIYSIKNKINNLIDMRAGGEIDKKTFVNKKQELDKKLEILNEEIKKYEQNTNEIDDVNQRLELIKFALKEELDFKGPTVSPSLVDAFVDRIIVDGNTFKWHLRFMPDDIECIINGTKKNAKLNILNYNSESPFCDTPHRQY